MLTPSRKFSENNNNTIITINSSPLTNNNNFLSNSDINSNSSFSMNNSPKQNSPSCAGEYSNPMHPTANQFSHSHGDFLLQTTVTATTTTSFGGGSGIHPIYNSTLPVLTTPSNGIVASPSFTTPSPTFQMMSHLMNSFV